MNQRASIFIVGCAIGVILMAAAKKIQLIQIQNDPNRLLDHLILQMNRLESQVSEVASN